MQVLQQKENLKEFVCNLFIIRNLHNVIQMFHQNHLPSNLEVMCATANFITSVQFCLIYDKIS